MSLRAYAQRRGVSPESVSKAIASGRLHESVVLVAGKPKIADADLADREWEASTRTRVDTARGTELHTSRARLEVAKATLLERQLEQFLSEHIDAGDFDRRIARIRERERGVVARCRGVVLALAARAQQRDPSLSERQKTLIEALVRDALVELELSEDRP